MISVLLNLLRFVLWPNIWSTLEMFHVHFRRKPILLLLNGMFGKHLLSPSGLMCSLRPMFPCWLSVTGWSIHWCKWVIKVPYYYCIAIYPFESESEVAQSCLTLWDPVACRTLGFRVHHQLQGLAQTHVHRISDAIQPS